MITVDIRTLVRAESGSSGPFAFSEPKPVFEDLSALRDLTGSGTVTQLGDRYLVAGVLSGKIGLECSRCLTPFTHRIADSFSEEFAKQPADEQFPAETERLVLDPMLRTVMLTGLPKQPLHDPGCKGLCAICGKDLNERPHAHPRSDDDGPFAALKKLRP